MTRVMVITLQTPWIFLVCFCPSLVSFMPVLYDLVYYALCCHDFVSYILHLLSFSCCQAILPVYSFYLGTYTNLIFPAWWGFLFQLLPLL